MNRAKLRLSIGFVGAFAVCYGVPNGYQPFAEPRYLPLTGWEENLPFVPASFVVYVSAYLLYALAVWAVPTGEAMQRFARCAFAILLLCGLAFFFWPTIYPRPAYPNDAHPFLLGLMAAISAFDNPANCCPSLHVAYAILCTWVLREQPWPYVLMIGLWALAIIISTLTTKQHYALDVVVATALTIGVILLESRLWPRGAR